MDHADQVEKKIITIGERWQPRVAAQVNQRTIGQKWLRFSQAVQQRHQSVGARTGLATAIAERQHPQRLETGDWQTLGQPPLSSPAPFNSSGDRLGAGPDLLPSSSRGETRLAEADAVESRSRAAPLPVRRPLSDTHQEIDEATTMRSTTRPLTQGARERSASSGHNAVVGQTTAQASFAAVDGQRLPARTQQLLEKAFHLRTTGVKLHVGVAADTIARRLQADAVTVGDHVFFRSSKYDPASAPGIGLLGHELTHIAQNRLAEAGMNSQAPWHNRHDQEEVALRNEQQIVAHLVKQPEGGGFPISSSVGLPSIGNIGATTTPSPAAAPQTAASGRNGAALPPVAGEPALSPRQLQQIKEAVYRDLMDRIRTEFERGG